MNDRDPIDTSTLGPVRIVPPAPDDWTMPYRSIDAGGSPESAGHVGHAWLVAIAREEHARSPAGLDFDHPPLGHHSALYRDCKLIAAYTVIRDPMNFAILLRWRANAPGSAAGRQ